MNTLTNKLVGVELSFHFPKEVIADDLAKIKRKVQRMIEGSDYSANAMFFADRYNIRVVIGYEVVDFNPYKTYDQMKKPLQRLIDSHPEAATYGFSN
jgi:hypothetical protein